MAVMYSQASFYVNMSCRIDTIQKIPLGRASATLTDCYQLIPSCCCRRMTRRDSLPSCYQDGRGYKPLAVVSGPQEPRRPRVSILRGFGSFEG